MSEYECTFQCKNGENIKVIAAYCGEEIQALTNNGQKIGCFSFKLIEEEYREYLYLTHMHLGEMSGKYIRQGIGRKCLEIAQELSGLEIYAAENDGNVQEDGSHLTEMAIYFIESMKKEGLISG
jgi:hypothetical protein